MGIYLNLRKFFRFLNNLTFFKYVLHFSLNPKSTDLHGRGIGQFRPVFNMLRYQVYNILPYWTMYIIHNIRKGKQFIAVLCNHMIFDFAEQIKAVFL